MNTQSASTEQLLQQLNWRYATKKFDPARTIPGSVWDALEKALVLTPSSYGLQPWKALVITDPKVREALKPVAWNQPPGDGLFTLCRVCRQEQSGAS